MDEKKRIEDIKKGLKKSVYEEAARIKVTHSDATESTEKLSNILDGYVDKIDTIEAANMEELEEELRVLKNENVEVGAIGERDLLVQQYNDYIHNDLDRTIAETVEYTYNFDNHTDDLNDILTRPMDDSNQPIEMQSLDTESVDGNDTDELFEIEATTDLGVLEDIVQLESDDTLSIEGAVEDEEEDKEVKTKKRAQVITESDDEEDDFADEKGLAVLDYALIIILIVVFLIFFGLIAKINGAF